jgi:DNA-binding response OmpR family regulator
MKYSLIYFDDLHDNIEVYQNLLEDSFKITGCSDCRQFEQFINSSNPHAIMLDLHMPVMDGIELYKKIIVSDHYNGCPIFIISGDVSDESRLRTFQAGAIDFFSRDISAEELLLRLKSKIKIYLQGVSSLMLGNLKLDSNTYTVSVNGGPRDLTLAEMRILSFIVRASPEIVKTNDLLESIWGSSTKAGKILVHISNMTLKLHDWDHEIKSKGDQISIQKKLV